MTRMWTLGLLTLAAMGCGAEAPTDSADPYAAERAFSDAHARAACGLYDRCGLLEYYGATLEGCISDLDAATFTYVTEEDCAFDPSAGADCVAEFDAASCDVDTGSAAAPTACDRVCGG